MEEHESASDKLARLVSELTSVLRRLNEHGSSSDLTHEQQCAITSACSLFADALELSGLEEVI